MPNLSPHSAPKSLTQRTFFNKTAESRISQLDFDAALTALVAIIILSVRLLQYLVLRG